MNLYFEDRFGKFRQLAFYPYAGDASEFVNDEGAFAAAFAEIKKFLEKNNIFKTDYTRVVPYKPDYVSLDLGFNYEFFILTTRKLD